MERFGPGPVFASEWKALTRRWQPYALQAAFVSTVLISLTVSWWSLGGGQPMSTDDQLGRLGEAFYKGIVVAMLGSTLAISPAVSCGAICRDKARGHLEHLLVSDLSGAEIVLGKLAAWLAPSSFWPPDAASTAASAGPPGAAGRRAGPHNKDAAGRSAASSGVGDAQNVRYDRINGPRSHRRSFP